eukprot:scaffold341951_cov19-Prasinocladus_malaysianus.AAC.1
MPLPLAARSGTHGTLSLVAINYKRHGQCRTRIRISTLVPQLMVEEAPVRTGTGNVICTRTVSAPPRPTA